MNLSEYFKIKETGKASLEICRIINKKYNEFLTNSKFN